MEGVFKWQNILKGRCPKCEKKLLTRKARGESFKNCEDALCGFGISELRMLEYLKDPEHPIHRFTTSYQEDLIHAEA